MSTQPNPSFLFRLAPRCAVLLLLLLSGGCGAAEDSAPPDSDETPGAASPGQADPFSGTPADGPLADIGPAPESYRPTAAGAPSTDIWVGTLVRSGGSLTVEGLSNVTDREGYDNQPAFSPDGTALYYVSAVDSTQTEILRHDLASGSTERVTRTADASEFSPMPIPGQDALSAIHETRGKQYLWRYGTDGSDLGPIFSTAEPVGYHAWADGAVTLMFILGSPATLQMGNALTGDISVVAESPGRSIHRIPGSNHVSFVRKVGDGEWWIERLDPGTGASDRLVRTFEAREDYAWTPAGEILMGDGALLHSWSSDSGWTEVARLDGEGMGTISRLAVAAQGGHVAVVMNRGGP